MKRSNRNYKFSKPICGGVGSGEYAEKPYVSIEPGFELVGHGKRPKTYRNNFPDFLHF